MGYTEISVKRILELIKEIEERKEHPNAAATYKDVPALCEIDRIVKEQLVLEEPCDRDTLIDSIFAVRYLGTSYETMWRIAYANKYYKWLFDIHSELYRRFGEKDKELADDYYTALRARNYYGKDECSDLIELAKGLISDSKRLKIEKEILEDFCPLKHDPVELSDKYLEVIDEVDRLMDVPENKNVHSFVRNERFQALLLQYGIEWEPMTSLNPGWHFD
ncbi:MAG: hypothetical protein E7593_06215 [Ruminococcaceae bacterium]|nr:hypothetical protein [Oscillospiraceae bacterium]MBE6707636.1 hypothetical protein [Oscillospiraceae bacterium]